MAQSKKLPWEERKNEQMKTTSVRIRQEQKERCRKIADYIPGGRVDTIVQRAVDLWLETEGPVYEEAFQRAQEKLERKGQGVTLKLVESVASA